MVFVCKGFFCSTHFESADEQCWGMAVALYVYMYVMASAAGGQSGGKKKKKTRGKIEVS